MKLPDAKIKTSSHFLKERYNLAYLNPSIIASTMKATKSYLTLFVASLFFLPNLDAATLKVLNPASAFNAGYDVPTGFKVSTFASILGNDFNSIITGSLGDSSYLTGADAIIVNLINPGSSYSAAEIATLTGIFSGTTRSLIFFENNSWTASNNVLAGLVSGSYIGESSDSAPINGLSPLSAGITGSINTAAAGQISGGVQVVGSVLTLRGPESNVILLGDVNMFDNSRITGNNLLLAQNVSSFLAVPEPSAAVLLLAGSGLCFRRRRI